MPCEHACGSTTGCDRDGLLWIKAFVKGACSRPSCSTYLFSVVPNQVIGEMVLDGGGHFNLAGIDG